MFNMLTGQLDITGENYSCGAEWIKDDRNRLHIVQRYDLAGDVSLVLKYAQRPVNHDEFGRILDAHLGAQTALSGDGVNIVPEVLAQDRKGQAYLMRHVAGDTFLDLCRAQEDHAPLLRRAGAWLSAFHAGTRKEKRAFQPKFMVKHMQKLVGQMQAGERRINGQKQFIAYAQNIAAHVGSAEGHQGTIAAKHGDLNAHNLLMSDETTAAFDFLGADPAPVGYDIARFLQSYSQMVGDLDDLPKGYAVPKTAWDAFFDGYQLVGREDPTVAFLTKVQVLTDWNRMQDKTTISGIVRLERVKRIARQAFA
ncbi:MAG: phosphotransferase [Sulfitobacter sp.]